MHKKVSKTSKMHFAKLVFRTMLFLTALALYLSGNGPEAFVYIEKSSFILPVLTAIFLVEIYLRFFPSDIESMGCQKQFKINYREKRQLREKIRLNSWKSTLAVAVAWFILNGAIGVLFFNGIIDEGILWLIAIAYSVCDMICILFYCPFHHLFMKNKCCTTCRIYNWDFAMMFTPLMFTKNIFAWCLVIASLVLLIQWEVLVYMYPERFLEETNESLECRNCKEKLCAHKKHLQYYLKQYRQIHNVNKKRESSI